MLPKATRGKLPLTGGVRIPYMTMGSGPVPLVVIPGAGDGLTTVYDGALQLRLYFARRLKDFRLLLLSRREPLPERFTLEQQAEDMLAAMDTLGWPASFLELNSAAGPVGQWMAVRRPERTLGLILSVTFHRTAESTRNILSHWIQLAEEGRWRDLNWSSIEYTFRPSTVAKYRLARPLLGLLKPPAEPARLPRMLSSLLDVDNRAILPGIACPALVIGGADDRVIPADIQQEMAALIPNSKLVLYEGYGHSNDQENPDYERQVRAFVQENRLAGN